MELVLLRNLRAYDKMNQNYEARRNHLAQELARRVRFTKKDIIIALRELERKKHLRRINNRKVKIL